MKRKKTRQSLSDFLAGKEAARIRATKREDNRKFIDRMERVTGLAYKKLPTDFPDIVQKPRPIKKGKLKEQIVRLLGLLDKKYFGPLCRIHGRHRGTLAYHVTPAGQGDAARFDRRNVVWACRAANYGEMRNRALYRRKHVEIFGQQYVDALEAVAATTVHYTMAELYELRAKLTAELGAA